MCSCLQGGKTIAGRPQLRIIEPHMHYYDELSNDALSIRGFQGYRCNDYHLGQCYIISGSEVISSRSGYHFWVRLHILAG